MTQIAHMVHLRAEPSVVRSPPPTLARRAVALSVFLWLPFSPPRSWSVP